MKKVMITGNGGFIGGSLFEELKKIGFETYGLEDNYFQQENWTQDLLSFLNYVEPEIVFHVGACSDTLEKNVDYMMTRNYESTKIIMDWCKEKDVPMIYSSTAANYGTNEKYPSNLYGWSKYVGEGYVISNGGIALRYFNPAGADASGMIGELPLGKAANLVPIITQAAAGVYEQPIKITGVDFPTPDGSAIRNYVHVTDLAKAHLAALEWLETQNINTFDVFNIGTGRGTSVIEMIDTFVMQVEPDLITAEKADRRPGDPAEVWCDASKAKSVLGWEAELSVLDILKSAWTWEQKVRGLDI